MEETRGTAAPDRHERGPEAAAGRSVPPRAAFRYWLRLGFINFGGPAGQIAIMHEELVDERRWISERRFLHALNYCMLLPGPEAQQLAIYIGWLLNGTLGGIVAGVLFVLPAFFMILGLSWTYAVHGDVGWVEAVFHGLQAAVIAIVAAAVLRIGSKALKDRAMILVATGSFVAIFFVKVPFPLIIGVAALLGIVLTRVTPPTGTTSPALEDDRDVDDAVLGDTAIATRSRSSLRRNVLVIGIGLAVWWIPLLAVMLWRGSDDTLSDQAIFFSQTALVTFGGAYAVLSYINQAAIQTFGWLEPGQMVTGLGLAESTPGPLIMVTEFVGFLAAYRFPGSLDPVVAGILGASVAVWATFAPCFLWIFLGAPYIERLRNNQALSGALTSITAAVVGVILNLAVTFGIVALFDEVRQGHLLGTTFLLPDLGSVDGAALVLVAVAFVGLWRYRWNVIWVVAGSAVAGLLYRTLT